MSRGKEEERQQLINGDDSPVPYGSDETEPFKEPPSAYQEDVVVEAGSGRPKNAALAWLYDHRKKIPGYGLLRLVKGASIYSLYVLFVLLMAYLLNQLDRYTLPIVTSDSGYDLQYGDRECMKNRQLSQEIFDEFNITSNVTDICTDEAYYDEFLNVTYNVK